MRQPGLDMRMLYVDRKHHTTEHKQSYIMHHTAYQVKCTDNHITEWCFPLSCMYSIIPCHDMFSCPCSLSTVHCPLSQGCFPCLMLPCVFMISFVQNNIDPIRQQHKPTWDDGSNGRANKTKTNHDIVSWGAILSLMNIGSLKPAAHSIKDDMIWHDDVTWGDCNLPIPSTNTPD